MKKITSLLLAALLVLSLTACGGGKTTGAEQPADPLELLETVWKAYGKSEKFSAVGGDYENPVEDAPGKVNTADAENLNYMLSLPVDSAALVTAAASLTHMMNANTFTCGAFQAAQEGDAGKLAAALREGIQTREWMCGFPDKLVIFTMGNFVVSVYGVADLVNTFRDKLQSCYSGAAIAYEENIL